MPTVCTLMRYKTKVVLITTRSCGKNIDSDKSPDFRVMVFKRDMVRFWYLSEYRHIVRILGNDIPGDKKPVVGLTQIRGIGYNFANAILTRLGINPDSSMGYMSEETATKIEELIKDPQAAGFPTWFLNRRKDIETGKDAHLLTSDIAFTIRKDIERERQANSWRGYRHLYGLKVRGQRTRTTGRKGGTVGVAKGGKAQPGK